MNHLVIGTAGHIDHGKTSLVKALTGIDTDRLKEEKDRGITIELGFAHLDLPGVPPVGIVDVPGHEKFIHHMVAGVTGIDLVLLVIAADEGIMPQTREHLDICRLLGVRKGLVALTKVDLVEPDWLALVREEVQDFVSGTFLEGSPVLPLSSSTGEGLDGLREAIADQLAGLPPRPTTAVPRLHVDRVFTMKGFGTVVTGTLVSGTLKVGEPVEVLPEKREYRIRGLQVHGRSVDSASAGQRTAVNLQGAERSALHRGDTVTLPGAIEPSFLMDAHLALLPSAPRPLLHRTRLRLHLGTSENLTRVVLLGRERLKPGDDGMVQFRLESPGVALPRDRFVVRSYSPIVTLGGGELIDSHPAKHKGRSSQALHDVEVLASGDLAQSALLLLRAAKLEGLGDDRLAGRLNIDRKEALSVLDDLSREGSSVPVPGRPPLFLHAAAVEDYEGRALKILETFHGQEPLKAGLSKEELRSRLSATPRSFPLLLERLKKAGKIALEKDLVRLSGHKVRLRSDQEAIKKRVEEYFYRKGLQPPVNAVIGADLGIDPALLRESVALLQAEEKLEKITEDLSIHRESLSPLRKKLVDFLGSRGRVTMQDFKEISDLSRKYTIPIMEYFDRTGLTIRVGDHRVLRKST